MSHAGDGSEGSPATLRDIFMAILEMRRADPSGNGGGVASQEDMEEEISRTLDDLVGRATLVFPPDDEDDGDADYRPPHHNPRVDDDGDEEEDEEDEDDDDDEEDDDDEYGYGWDHPAGPNRRWHPEVKDPKPAGLALLCSGDFGRVAHQTRSRSQGTNKNLARLLGERAVRLRPTPREDLVSDMIPNSNGTAVASYAANAYVGQYSSDSSFYYTCVRDFRLHVYDTTAPLTPTSPLRGGRIQQRRHPLGFAVDVDDDHVSSMKVMKTINAQPGGWTITDSHLSPDNQRLIYASVSNIVYMAHTIDATVQQHAINFADPHSRGGRYGYGDPFGVWSCKFSADGNEVIAGGTEMVFVYDLLADKRTVKIKAHKDDINSCTWADTASGNVLVSASDDSFLKVWDRRSLGTSPKPSGVLIGHTEGITYVSAKGDGRYVISNGKDQVLRLWDLRKMRSSLEHEQVQGHEYGIPNYDYRRGSYPRPRHQAHPLDCSVMQYTGHEVFRTLIRCHFSPEETTGGQYIYSGGADGRIHIWSLDGRVVQVLDRSGTLAMSYDPSEPHPPQVKLPQRKVCVRDVSWHSQQPILMSAGWLGTGWGAAESSVIARHEWKGLAKMGYNLQDHQEKARVEAQEAANARRGVVGGARGMPGAFLDGLIDDEL